MLITRMFRQKNVSVCLVGAIMLLCLAASAQLPLFQAIAQEEGKNVLILNSYHQGFDWSDKEMQGIMDALPEHVNLSIEYMDTKRLSGDDYFRLLYEVYKQKYANTQFDSIVALDNNAFEFILQYRDELFPGTPLIFGGVNYFDDSIVAGQDQVTGVAENIDHLGTIDIALKLHPNTKELLIITDQTTTGQTHRAYLEQLDREGRFPVEFVFLDQGDGLDLPQLLKIVGNAPPDSLIYYSDFFRDKHGNLMNYEEALPILSEASAVPIYNTGDFYLGYGTTGGKLTSGYYEGRAVGEMVAQVLNGESASAIPIEREGITKYMFDYEQLSRWGVRSSALPQDSIVINTPDSLFSRYREFVLGGIIFIFGQTLIIIFLIVSIMRRRKAEGKLRQYSEHLEEMFDDRTQELQEAQAQLVQQERLATLGHLAGSVAHELHNPLGAIRNTTYYLGMVLEDPPAEVRESLDILDQEVMTSEHIISKLLEFAHPEPAIRRKMDINLFLKQTLSQTAIPETIDVVTQLDVSNLFVEADPEQLEVVFDNLIQNAVQAMSPPLGNGGQLTIELTRLDEAWVSIYVRDTGVGIPQENVSKLFEPLFTTKAKGIGLGLALSGIMIKENGGIIKAESNGVPGQGSEFIVNLPLMKEIQKNSEPID